MGVLTLLAISTSQLLTPRERACLAPGPLHHLSHLFINRTRQEYPASGPFHPGSPSLFSSDETFAPSHCEKRAPRIVRAKTGGKGKNGSAIWGSRSPSCSFGLHSLGGESDASKLGMLAVNHPRLLLLALLVLGRRRRRSGRSSHAARLGRRRRQRVRFVVLAAKDRDRGRATGTLGDFAGRAEAAVRGGRIVVVLAALLLATVRWVGDLGCRDDEPDVDAGSASLH